MRLWGSVGIYGAVLVVMGLCRVWGEVVGLCWWLWGCVGLWVEVMGLYRVLGEVMVLCW